MNAAMEMAAPGFEFERPLDTAGPQWCMGREPRMGLCCRRPLAHAGPHRIRIQSSGRVLEWKDGDESAAWAP